MSETEMPKGCLGCNEAEIAAVLVKHGVARERFTEVPPTSHAWADVLPCAECGRFWLLAPRSAPPAPDKGPEPKTP